MKIFGACQFCGKGYYTRDWKRNVLRHLIHCPKNPDSIRYKCNICSKEFYKRHELIGHSGHCPIKIKVTIYLLNLNKMKTGVELIAEERQRQIEKYGSTDAHDIDHDDEQLAQAAMTYAMPEYLQGHCIHSGGAKRFLYLDEGMHKRTKFPLYPEGWQMTSQPYNRIHDLMRAGAFIAAEIDRLNKKG
jgi:hypothetical protein